MLPRKGNTPYDYETFRCSPSGHPRSRNPAPPPLPLPAVPIRQLAKPALARLGSWSKPTEAEAKEPPIIEYECLTCHRRYRLRGPKFYEVLADGSERAYMREGRYGRWLSCR